MEPDEREMLLRVDERTKSIDTRVKGVNEKIKENEANIDTLESRVSRNTTIINGVTLGLGSALTAIFTKLGGFFKF